VSVVSVTYERSLQRAECLEPGEWTDVTASGRVAVCCKDCSQTFDLSEFHRVEEDGRVVPAVRCDNDACLTFGYITLRDWAEAVVPA
jgi:hypothetical protein